MEWALPHWSASDWLAFWGLVVAILGAVGGLIAWHRTHHPLVIVRAFLATGTDAGRGRTQHTLSVTVTNVRPVPVHLQTLRIDVGEGWEYHLGNNIAESSLPQRLEHNQPFRWVERLVETDTDWESGTGISEDAWVGKPRRFRVLADTNVGTFRSGWQVGRLYDHTPSP